MPKDMATMAGRKAFSGGLRRLLTRNRCSGLVYVSVILGIAACTAAVPSHQGNRIRTSAPCSTNSSSCIDGVDIAAQTSKLRVIIERVKLNDTVIFTICSSSYVKHLENWVIFLVPLGLHRHFFVFAQDEETLAFSERRWPGQALMYQVTSADGVEIPKTGQNDKVAFNTIELFAMMVQRTTYIRVVLRLGFSLLMSDNDMVWLRSPLPFLLPPSPFHAVFQVDGKAWGSQDWPHATVPLLEHYHPQRGEDNDFNPCGCFIYLRREGDSRELVDRWIGSLMQHGFGRAKGESFLNKNWLTEQGHLTELVKNITLEAAAAAAAAAAASAGEENVGSDGEQDRGSAQEHSLQRFSNFSLGLLPPPLFPSGHRDFRDTDFSRVVLLHANAVYFKKKERRFREFGLWLQGEVPLAAWRQIMAEGGADTAAAAAAAAAASAATGAKASAAPATAVAGAAAFPAAVAGTAAGEEQDPRLQEFVHKFLRSRLGGTEDSRGAMAGRGHAGGAGGQGGPRGWRERTPRVQEGGNGEDDGDREDVDPPVAWERGQRVRAVKDTASLLRLMAVRLRAKHRRSAGLRVERAAVRAAMAPVEAAAKKFARDGVVLLTTVRRGKHRLFLNWATSLNRTDMAGAFVAVVGMQEIARSIGPLWAPHVVVLPVEALLGLPSDWRSNGFTGSSASAAPQAAAAAEDLLRASRSIQWALPFALQRIMEANLTALVSPSTAVWLRSPRTLLLPTFDAVLCPPAKPSDGFKPAAVRPAHRDRVVGHVTASVAVLQGSLFVDRLLVAWQKSVSARRVGSDFFLLQEAHFNHALSTAWREVRALNDVVVTGHGPTRNEARVGVLAGGVVSTHSVHRNLQKFKETGEVTLVVGWRISREEDFKSVGLWFLTDQT